MHTPNKILFQIVNFLKRKHSWLWKTMGGFLRLSWKCNQSWQHWCDHEKRHRWEMVMVICAGTRRKWWKRWWLLIMMTLMVVMVFVLVIVVVKSSLIKPNPYGCQGEDMSRYIYIEFIFHLQFERSHTFYNVLWNTVEAMIWLIIMMKTYVIQENHTQKVLVENVGRTKF